MKRHLVRRTVLTIATLAAVAIGWFLFAPPILGGTTSYVVVRGISMTPHLRGGDLVVLRGQRAYGRGDVVAYRNGDLDAAVLHRILHVEDDRFVLKGDNNDFVDSYRPVRAELLGRQWLRIPHGGTVVAWLHVPTHAAILAAVLAFLAAGGVGARTAHRWRRPMTGDLRRTALVVAAGAGGAFALLGLLAYTRAPSRLVAVDGLYVQHGAFAYSADAPGGRAVYGGDVATTGQPLYLNLVKRATIRFSYRFGSPVAHEIAGRARIVAFVRGADGWRRDLPLRPSFDFTGDRFHTETTLNLAGLRRALANVATLTGVPPSSYTVTLQPVVEVHGTVAGAHVADSFSPELAFELTPSTLQLDPDAAAHGAPTPLNQTRAGQVAQPAPNVLSALRLQIDVRLARLIALAGGAFSLLALLVLALVRPRSRRDTPEAVLIAHRFGERLIPTSGIARTSQAVVEVADFEAVLRLSDHYGRPILHELGHGVDTYGVYEAGVMYRYCTRPVAPAPVYAANGDGVLAQA